MEQTEEDLHVMVLSTRDLRVLSVGAWILTDKVERMTEDMIRNGRPVESISEMVEYSSNARRLAQLLDEEAKD